MTTTRRVRKEVTAHVETSGCATFRSHSVAWVADESGDYIEIDRGNGSMGWVHVLDWDRYQRNYPEVAGL